MGACRFFVAYVFMQGASPGIAIVLLRFVLLAGNYPFLMVAAYSSLPFFLGVLHVLFTSYCPREKWKCGLQKLANVPRYLMSGDILLMQLPYCGSHLFNALALSQPNMTALRAILASKVDIVIAITFAMIPQPAGCCRKSSQKPAAAAVVKGGGLGEAVGTRHCCPTGLLSLLFGLLLTAAAIGGFVMVRRPPNGSWGLWTVSSEPMLGYVYIGAARLCYVLRVCNIRASIRRNAAKPHLAALVPPSGHKSHGNTQPHKNDDNRQLAGSARNGDVDSGGDIDAEQADENDLLLSAGIPQVARDSGTGSATVTAEDRPSEHTSALLSIDMGTQPPPPAMFSGFNPEKLHQLTVLFQTEQYFSKKLLRVQHMSKQHAGKSSRSLTSREITPEAPPPVHLLAPVGIGGVATAEIAWVGGSLLLAPAALLACYIQGELQTGAGNIKTVMGGLGLPKLAALAGISLGESVRPLLLGWFATTTACKPIILGVVDHILDAAIPSALATSGLLLTKGSKETDSTVPGGLGLDAPQLIGLLVLGLSTLLLYGCRAAVIERRQSWKHLGFLSDALPELAGAAPMQISSGPPQWPGGKGEGWGTKNGAEKGSTAGPNAENTVPQNAGGRNELPAPAEKDFVSAISVSIGDGQAVFDRLLVESAYTGVVPGIPPPRWLDSSVVSSNVLLMRARDHEDDRQLVARIRRHSASSAQVMATAESQQSTAEVLTPHNEADVASIEVGQSTQQQADATDESVVATTETGGRI